VICKHSIDKVDLIIHSKKNCGKQICRKNNEEKNAKILDFFISRLKQNIEIFFLKVL